VRLSHCTLRVKVTDLKRGFDLSGLISATGYSINSAPDSIALVRVSNTAVNFGIVNTSCHRYIHTPKAIKERMNNGKANLSFIKQSI